MAKQVSPSRLLDLDARRVCLIKPSALGDVVQTLPLLPVLRERFPQAKISWVVGSGLAELLEGHPFLDEVIPFDRRSSGNGWLRLLRGLRSRSFDLVFDLQGLFRTAVMTAATRAPLRIGLQTAREGAQWACHGSIPDTGRQTPAHLRYWRVAEALGMGHLRRETHIPIRNEDREWSRTRCEDLRRPILAIHPGARWVTKRWPVEKFAVLAAKATRFYGFSMVLVGSCEEQPAAAHLEHLLRRFTPAAKILNLAGKTTLRQLAAVLERADVMLTNDSGPMHLAAGLGTPVVGLFTCTSPVRSGPPGDVHELVSTKVSCAAHYKKQCPFRGAGHLACMDELNTDRVWRALVRLIEKPRQEMRAA